MAQIGEWVLRTSCRHIRLWREQGLVCHGRIAINVSARQFEDPSFLERINKVLEETSTTPSHIELELTESCFMHNPERTSEIMAALKHLGFSIAIDDFGTGYSSLGYLKRFPIDTLKIDQSFVKNMLEDNNDRAIISVILAISQQMEMDTIAEGVETEEQCKALLGLGCRLAQGYYFSRPLPMEDFLKNHLNSLSIHHAAGWDMVPSPPPDSPE